MGAGSALQRRIGRQASVLRRARGPQSLGGPRYLLDVGVNWYLNKFVKVYFDWEYAMFDQPVYYSPGHFTKTNSLFWLRLQAWF